MANVHEPEWDSDTDQWRRARLGEQAFRGRLTLRTFDGERELEEGEVVACPRGQGGAHGFENRTSEPVRVLLLGEKNVPNVSVYPDTNEIGLFDAPRPADRRFGGRFRLDDAVSGYAGGEPEIPASPSQ